MENVNFSSLISCEKEQELTNIKQTIQQKIFMWKIKAKMENDKIAVWNLVCQHLTTSELLNACLVSCGWNFAIGKTEAFTKKVIFKSTEGKLAQKSRSYGNLEIKIRNTQMEIKNTEEMIKSHWSSLRTLKIIKFGG